MLKPIEKKSLSDAVFEQLRDRIVSGDFEPGSSLPAERALCDMLGVNRGAVREALKRLEQARLVSIQHGGATRVLDFRENAGTDLLAALVLRRDGSVDPGVVRGVMELRSALGADIARRCAERTPEAGQELLAVAERMRQAQSGLEGLLAMNMEFWAILVDGARNVAYRLVYNSVAEMLEQFDTIFRAVLSEEISDAQAHERIARAVSAGDVDDAEFYARDLMSRGERRVGQIASLIEEA